MRVLPPLQRLLLLRLPLLLLLRLLRLLLLLLLPLLQLLSELPLPAEMMPPAPGGVCRGGPGDMVCSS